jgi:hypothetical protein
MIDNTEHKIDITKKLKDEEKIKLMCGFCGKEINNYHYIWCINKDSSKTICCLDCKNKKSMSPLGYF